jgi:hypothetical protein
MFNNYLMKYHKVSDKIPEIIVLINKDFARGLVISFFIGALVA